METGLSKEIIQHLVAKYEKAKENGQVGNYTEEDTKKDFIMPLFEALGWDTANRNEISSEESIKSAGRVDYGFYINNRAVFYLEAKKLRADLHKEDYANQAIRYSWNKGVTWAILTDFESIKIFNSENISEYLYNKLVFEIPYTEYIERFDQLLLLSKESFENNKLESYARSIGKLQQKVPVSELLYKDLNESRAILTADLSRWNESVSPELIDEGVQKLLDRLLFIRVAEDRGIEPQTLVPLVRAWENSGNKNQIPLYKSMISKFRELDEVYNSNLFSPHPFEEWEEYSNATQKVIQILYGKPGYYEYDFKLIPADILGNVYENYLGYKLSQSQKGLSVDKDSRKQKEQGIYYTPAFIVNYIVESSLKPVLDRCESIGDLKKIKILDPACGSGSFLIKALELVNEKYKEFGAPGDEITKLIILKDNIYGVDLDAQAVDIARLNLIINCFDRKMKLNSLSGNIKCGNSLIYSTDEDLKKYFGKNYRDKKPFNWEKEFPEVFSQGGFDVIIGNPPYVSFYSKQSQANSDTKEDLNYYISNYNFIENKNKLGRFNTLMFFIEKGISCLREGGTIGYLVDTNIHSNPSLEIRKFLSTQTSVIKIVDEIKAFKNVASSQLIFIAKKDTNLQENINWYEIENESIKFVASKPYDYIETRDDYGFELPKDDITQGILSKIKKHATLQDIVGKKFIRTCITFTGKKEFFVFSKKETEIDYPLAEGSFSLPYPYACIRSQNYIRYDISLRDKLNKEYEKEAHDEGKRSPKVIGLGDLSLFRSPKIFIRLSDKRITATYTEQFYCADLSLYILTLPDLKTYSENYSLYYLLGILNSKVITYFMIQSNLIGNFNTGTPQIRLDDIRKIPIPINNTDVKKLLEDKVKTVLELNNNLSNMVENSNEWIITKSQISNYIEEIDQTVYALFGLEENEVELIEEVV